VCDCVWLQRVRIKTLENQVWYKQVFLENFLE
jgi:hypothetical protein